MTNDSARVKISIPDGLIEIEGSEVFVTTQLAKFVPLVEKLLESTPIQLKKKSITGEVEKNSASTDLTGFAEYENVFAIADGKVQVLKDLPGANKSQKMVNAALLLAYANQLQDVSSTSYDSVRALCAAHACLDSTNFSSVLKSEKAYFIISGSPGSQSIALTVPGKKKAAELAKSLNA